MIDDPPLVQYRPKRYHTTSVPSTAYIRSRAHTLRIPDEVLDACPTMEALQTHIKTAYRALAKRYHPDHNTQTPGVGSATFRRITAAYHFLMKVSPALRLNQPQESYVWRLYQQLCIPLEGDWVAYYTRRPAAVLSYGWQYGYPKV